VGYGFFISDQNKKINEANAQLVVETKRVAICMEIENLQKQLDFCNKNVLSYAQDNEWVESILAETRTVNLLVASMETRAGETSTHGPYSVLVLRMQVQGTYLEMLKLLRWCDSPERIVRVDSLKIDRNAGYLDCEVSVRGLIKRTAPAKTETDQPDKPQAAEKATSEKDEKK
jgi:Tfp pilus assembly protein PilO